MPIFLSKIFELVFCPKSSNSALRQLENRLGHLAANATVKFSVARGGGNIRFLGDCFDLRYKIFKKGYILSLCCWFTRILSFYT